MGNMSRMHVSWGTLIMIIMFIQSHQLIFNVGYGGFILCSISISIYIIYIHLIPTYDCPNGCLPQLPCTPPSTIPASEAVGIWAPAATRSPWVTRCQVGKVPQKEFGSSFPTEVGTHHWFLIDGMGSAVRTAELWLPPAVSSDHCRVL